MGADAMGRRRSTPARRAVVTGGAGFIGSHLVDRLLADGIEVLIVDDLSTGRLANVPGAARVEAADISEADLERLFRAWQPATVFHLAAQSSVVRSVQDP